jgi:hypothetical protein
VPDDVTVEATDVDTPVDIGAAIATDLVDADVEIINDGPAAYPLGTTVVTWTASDDYGNSVSDTQNVRVIDKTPPVLTAPPDVTVEAIAPRTPVDIGVATATDIFEPLEIINDEMADYPVGTTTITWTASDPNGNATTGIQLVTVTDSTPPEISVPADITIYATDTLTPIDVGVATAYDLVDLDVPVTSDSPGVFPLGTTTVTWTSSDSRGNTSTATQRVTIQRRLADITYIGAESVQWSDAADLGVRVEDVTGDGVLTGPIPYYGTVMFSIIRDGVEHHSYTVIGTDSLGEAWTNHSFYDSTMPAGACTIRAEFTDSTKDIFRPVFIDQAFEIQPEAGVLEYTGEQVATIYDDTFYLQATLWQEENETDGELIDFDDDANPVSVYFHIYKFTQTPSIDGTDAYMTVGPVRLHNSTLHQGVGYGGIAVSIPNELGDTEENYTVLAVLADKRFIKSAYDEATFTIYDPDGRFFTGGGYILDPYSGDHNNFGLTFRFSKNGKAQGNVIYIIRDKTAGVKIRVKSNRLESAGFPPGDPVGTPTAIADGKANIEITDLETGEWLGGDGNLQFTVLVEDISLQGVGEDTFKLEVRYSDGVPYDPIHMYDKIIIEGGNIVVHDVSKW